MTPRILTAEEWVTSVHRSRAEGHDGADLIAMVQKVREETVLWAVHVALETGGPDAWRAAEALRTRSGEAKPCCSDETTREHRLVHQ